MPTRPTLLRSIPFWALVVASLATIAGGAHLLNDKLRTMTSTLDAGTATGVDVYVGQSLALLGAVLIGAGVMGVLLALGIAAAATLRPAGTASAPEAGVPAAENPSDSLTPGSPEPIEHDSSESDAIPAAAVR